MKKHIIPNPQIDWLQPSIGKKERKPSLKGFNHPSAQHIFFGDRKLDDHLKLVGNLAPLVILSTLKKIDFSDFEAQYNMKGRAPYHPRLILGLVLYGILKGQSSLRELEVLAGCDLGAIWITGGIIPDHATIGRFIQRHADLICVSFFEALTTEILGQLGQKNNVWSGDGTVIESAANRFKTLKMEVAQQQLHAQRESVEKEEADPKKKTSKYDNETLEKAIMIGREREKHRKKMGYRGHALQISLTDPQAAIIPDKRKKFVPAYVTSILSSQRIIIAAAVHPMSENRVVDELFKQGKRTTQQNKATVLMDKGYHSIQVAKSAHDSDLLLLSPRTRVRTRYFSKTLHFTRLQKGTGYRCPNGKLLKRGHKKCSKGRASVVFTAKMKDCQNCPLRGKCTSAKRRSIHESVDEEILIALRGRMEVKENQDLYKKRSGDVEPVFASIKDQQKLRRFHRKGLKSVKTEFVLHACAHNLGRLMRVFLRILMHITMINDAMLQSLQNTRVKFLAPCENTHNFGIHSLIEIKQYSLIYFSKRQPPLWLPGSHVSTRDSGHTTRAQ